MTSTKSKLIHAIGRLNGLIRNEEKKESKYQQFFELDPIVFNILGYNKHFVFTKESGKVLPPNNIGLQPAPDFMVINHEGLAEIFEIKTPFLKSRMITGDQYREKFSAEMESYISQTTTYEDYFTRDPSVRAMVSEMIGAKIQEDLDIKIIAGLNDDLDKAKVHKLSRRQKRTITILTYDDILKRLNDRFEDEYQLEEPGFMIHCVIRFFEQDKGGDSYIFDIGKELDQNRISVFIDAQGSLTFSLYDSEKQHQSVSIDSNHYHYNTWYYLALEYGKKNGNVVYSVSLDNELYDLRSRRAPEVLLNLENLVLGADLKYSHFSKFDISQFAITPIPKAVNRYDVMNYLRSIIVKSKTKKIGCDRYSGAQFGLGSSQYRRELIFLDPEYKPDRVQM